jgi:hypothetical protein
VGERLDSTPTKAVGVGGEIYRQGRLMNGKLLRGYTKNKNILVKLTPQNDC